jgi:hypothetical protein
VVIKVKSILSENPMLKTLAVLKALSVSHRFFLLVVLILSLVSLTACATPATPSVATPETPGARPTIPLPAQPTSQPVATRVVAPVVSATAPSIVSGSPVTPGAAPTSLPVAAVATATRPPATAAPVAAVTTAPGGAAGRAEIKVDFVIKLPSAEDVDDLRAPLVAIPGILAISGDDNAITIVYNPAQITPDTIKQRLSAMGHAVK